jgi:hypothetical protein
MLWTPATYEWQKMILVTVREAVNLCQLRPQGLNFFTASSLHWHSRFSSTLDRWSSQPMRQRLVDTYNTVLGRLRAHIRRDLQPRLRKLIECMVMRICYFKCGDQS